MPSSTIKVIDGGTSYDILFGARILRGLFKTWFGQDAKTKKIPKFVFSAPNEFKLNFNEIKDSELIKKIEELTFFAKDKKDFFVEQGKYVMSYEKSQKYANIFLETITTAIRSPIATRKESITLAKPVILVSEPVTKPKKFGFEPKPVIKLSSVMIFSAI